MRCSGWSSLAISVCSALVLAAPTAAHVKAEPTRIASGSSESVIFEGPNERSVPMTGFSLTVPHGLTLEHAHETEGWSASLSGSRATWTGGALPPEAVAAFGVTIEADSSPGFFDVVAVQRYEDGNDVRWTVPMTIVPAQATPSQNLTLAAIVVILGGLLVVAVVLLARRRRDAATRSA